MRFALLGKCFAVGERLERMETLEFEEVRIYCVTYRGEIVTATRMRRFIRKGMFNCCDIKFYNFELLRTFFSFFSFIALQREICSFHVAVSRYSRVVKKFSARPTNAGL